METEYFLQEEEQDKILYRNVFGTQRKGGALANAFDVNLKNVANTNVIKWGNRLFVFWEGGRPYELDCDTLETLPPTKNGGPFRTLGRADCALRGVTIDDGGPIDKILNAGRSFTAHPHVMDDDTLVAFTAAQNPQSKDMKMEFIEYDKDWQEKSRIKFSMPKSPAAPHDFSVSKDYYCFFQNRLALDTLPFILGLKAPTQVMQLHLDQPAGLHLVPRLPHEKPLDFDIPSFFVIHNVPRVVEQDGNRVTLYSSGWDLSDERFFPPNQKSVAFLGGWGGPFPDFLAGQVPPGTLFKTVVDTATEQLISHEPVIPGLVMEFPTQDDQSPRHVYFSVSNTDNVSLPGTGLCRLNLETAKAEYWWAGNKIFCNESIPVAKRNGEKGSWILSLLYDGGERRASLAIHDSERFEEGPIALIHLPHALTYGLHGSFASS